MSDWKLTYQGIEVPEDLYEAAPDPYEEALGIWQGAVDAALEAVDTRPEDSEYEYYATTDGRFVWRIEPGAGRVQIISSYDNEWETSVSGQEDLRRAVAQDPDRYERIPHSQVPSWVWGS